MNQREVKDHFVPLGWGSLDNALPQKPASCAFPTVPAGGQVKRIPHRDHPNGSSFQSPVAGPHLPADTTRVTDTTRPQHRGQSPLSNGLAFGAICALPAF